MSTFDLNDVQAGTYVLTALRWDQITSKPNEPFDFVRHRRGDEVELNVEDARRLLVAGAVKPKGEKSTEEVPGRSESKAPGSSPDADDNGPQADPDGNVDEVVAWINEGSTPEEVRERTEAALAREAERPKPRSTLVEKLEAALAAAKGDD